LQILKITSPEKQTQEIEKSLEVLRRGGVLCLPTDTVYGLAVDAHNKRAVEQIYKLKKRPKKKPLILFPKTHKTLVHLVKKIPPSSLKLISCFWPGPLTLIFKASITEPWCLVSKEGKIGVRIPNHPVPRKISKEDGILLATTSANLSGEKAVVEADKLSLTIKQGVDLILDSGKTSLGRESTVVDVTTETPKVLREGSVPEDDLKKVLKEKINILFVCTANMCRSVMAEALFKTIWSCERYPEVNIMSAGIYALHSYPPSTNTIQVLREKGIDVTSYRSTPVTSDTIKRSHIIFVMEKKHQEHLVRLYPWAENKIWLLKEFAHGKEEEVFDPTGGPGEAYQETARELQQDAEKIVERICGK